MVWDNIPYMVGGQVAHSAELARLALYVANSGREGIARPGDLAVVPLATPGAGVRVMAGAMGCINKSAGGDAESYAAKNDGYDTVALATTTGGPARSDFIYARIEDPYQSGNPWPVPASNLRQTAVYVRSVVLAGVPNTARTMVAAGVSGAYSGIPLARVDIPAGTAAVQAGHIVDLRQMIQPRFDAAESSTFKPGGVEAIPTSSNTWIANLTRPVWIPPWATHVNARLLITNLSVPSGSAATGTINLVIGTEQAPTTTFELNPANGARQTTTVSANRMYLPPALRGTMQTLRAVAVRSGGTSAVGVDTASMLGLDVTWLEAPV